MQWLFSKIRTLPASQLFSPSSLVNRLLLPQTRPMATIIRWPIIRLRTVNAAAQRHQENETRLIWRHTRPIITQMRHQTTQHRSSSPKHRLRAIIRTHLLKPQLPTVHPCGAVKLPSATLLMSRSNNKWRLQLATINRRGMNMSRQLGSRNRPMLPVRVSQQQVRTERIKNLAKKTQKSSITSCT